MAEIIESSDRFRDGDDDLFMDVDVEDIEKKHSNLEAYATYNPLNLRLSDYPIHPKIKEALTSPYAGLEQGSEGWHSFRLMHLNSSEIGAAMGVDTFKDTETLFKEKCLLISPEELHRRAQPANQEPLQHGHKNEPECGLLYCLRKKDLCFTLGSIEYREDPNYRFLASSIDMFALRGQNVAEIKCPYRAEVKEYTVRDIEIVKTSYAHQMQSQMLISGLHKMDFVQYGAHPNPRYPPGKSKLIITPIPYDPNWAPDILPRLRAFWDRVEAYRYQHSDWNQKPPPPFIPKQTIPLSETLENVRRFWDEDGYPRRRPLPPGPGSAPIPEEQPAPELEKRHRKVRKGETVSHPSDFDDYQAGESSTTNFERASML